MTARFLAEAVNGTSGEGAAHHGLEVDFYDVQMSLLFLIALWIAGKAVGSAGMPPLVGELVVGVVMGPQLLAVVPSPESLMLYGEVGLILLVVEAGLDVDLQMLRTIGPRGVGVAVTGTMLPVGIAAALGAGVLGLEPTAALAAGCTLAPTSMGIALNVLKRGQVLNTPTGQLIIAAAVLDDVIALLLLTLLQPKGGHTSLLAVLSPAFASAGLMLTAGAIARWGMPHLLACLGRAAPPAVLSARGGLKDKYLLLLLLCLASIFVPLAHVLGASHLLGAFLAGLCCCTEPRLHAAWTKQVKRPQSWLLKLFFAATCGFAVPIRSFSSPTVWAHASLFSLAAFGKIATGVWATPLTRANAATVGFAMAAWGEFAFIIATSSLNTGLITQTTFAALLLAVLFSVVVAPMLLRATIKRSKAKLQSALNDAMAWGGAGGAGEANPLGVEGSPASGGGPNGAAVAASAGRKSLRTGQVSQTIPVFYRLRTSAPPSWGLSVKAIAVMKGNGLEVLDFRSVAYHGAVLFEVYLKDPSLRVAARRPLPPADEGRVRARQGELLQLFAPIFGAGGSCVLERWLPGQGGAAPGASGAAAAAARTGAAQSVTSGAEGNAECGLPAVDVGAGSSVSNSPTKQSTSSPPLRYFSDGSPRPPGPTPTPVGPAPRRSPARGPPHPAFSGNLPPALAPAWERGSTAIEEDDQVGDRSYKYWARKQQEEESPFGQARWAEWGGQAIGPPQPLPPPVGFGGSGGAAGDVLRSEAGGGAGGAGGCWVGGAAGCSEAELGRVGVRAVGCDAAATRV